MSPRWIRAAAGLAALAPVVYLIVTIALGLALPGYSVVGDTQSELGASDAPRGWVMNFGGFFVLGLGVLAFALAYWAVLRGSLMATLAVALIVLAGVGTVAVSFFPCDPGCVDVTSTGRAHALLSAPGAIGLPGAAVLSAWVVRDKPAFGPAWAKGSFLAGATAFVAGPLVGLEVLDVFNGMIQRLGMWTALGWMSAICIRLWQVVGREDATSLPGGG